jgi:hypothetical protein
VVKNRFHLVTFDGAMASDTGCQRLEILQLILQYCYAPSVNRHILPIISQKSLVFGLAIGQAWDNIQNVLPFENGHTARKPMAIFRVVA